MFNESLISGNPVLFIILMAWSLIWKGIALWKAAHRESKPWFIALLIINTVGILEIIYIFIISKRQNNSEVIEVEEEVDGKVE